MLLGLLFYGSLFRLVVDYSIRLWQYDFVFCSESLVKC